MPRLWAVADHAPRENIREKESHRNYAAMTKMRLQAAQFSIMAEMRKWACQCRSPCLMVAANRMTSWQQLGSTLGSAVKKGIEHVRCFRHTIGNKVLLGRPIFIASVACWATFLAIADALLSRALPHAISPESPNRCDGHTWIRRSIDDAHLPNHCESGYRKRI